MKSPLTSMMLKDLTYKDLAQKSKDNIPDPQLLSLRFRLGRGLGDHSFWQTKKQEAGKEKRWVRRETSRQPQLRDRNLHVPASTLASYPTHCLGHICFLFRALGDSGRAGGLM